MISLQNAVTCGILRRSVIRGSITISNVVSRNFQEQDSIHEWFRLMQNNKEWAAETVKRDPEYFTVLKEAQVSDNMK